MLLVPSDNVQHLIRMVESCENTTMFLPGPNETLIQGVFKLRADRAYVSWANGGDIGAAFRLLEQVFPDFELKLVETRYEGPTLWIASINWQHMEWKEGYDQPPERYRFEARSKKPARAILLAVLRALYAYSLWDERETKKC